LFTRFTLYSFGGTGFASLNNEENFCDIFSVKLIRFSFGGSVIASIDFYGEEGPFRELLNLSASIYESIFGFSEMPAFSSFAALTISFFVYVIFTTSV
jgi:hypothetical protein